ncbi:MAG: hypothetical protein QOI24_3246 [Acidobacteriota bacterium]|jgi:hypothetical protein|nr:hypothetical protein [Acidobacteriota bacterium]
MTFARRQRGRTFGEVMFVCVILSAVIVGGYALLRPGAAKPAPPPVKGVFAEAPPGYKAMTTPDGLIPLKAVIAPSSGSIVYSSPNGGAATTKRLSMFESYFPIEASGDYVRVGNDPMSAASLGWVRRSEVILWPTREAMRPNTSNPDRRPLLLWDKRDSVGDLRSVRYRENAGSEPPQPYPVLAVDRGALLIALTWQSADYSRIGVNTAWTPPLTIPDDARFYYLTTREELKRHFEQYNQTLLEMRSGVSPDAPILKLLKNHVEVTVGEHIDHDDDPGFLRRILRELRNPLRLTDRQDADIRRDSETMRRKLAKLRTFYENPENWSTRGIGWLPADYLPGN